MTQAGRPADFSQIFIPVNSYTELRIFLDKDQQYIEDCRLPAVARNGIDLVSVMINFNIVK
jgi:hypothetical protein